MEAGRSHADGHPQPLGCPGTRPKDSNGRVNVGELEADIKSRRQKQEEEWVNKGANWWPTRVSTEAQQHIEPATGMREEACQDTRKDQAHAGATQHSGSKGLQGQTGLGEEQHKADIASMLLKSTSKLRAIQPCESGVKRVHWLAPWTG